MHYTLVMLTATWLPAAPGDAPLDAKAPTPAAATAPANPAPGEPTPEKPSFGTRLHNFFFPPRAESAPRPDFPMLEPRDVHTAAKLPVDQPATIDTKGKLAVFAAPTTVPVVKPAVTPAAATTVQALRPNFDLSEQDLKMVGHETDYSWITGKLAHAQGAGGRWVIHYSGPYEQDRYSGSLVLTGKAELASFHEGDLVCVHGKLAATSRMLHAGETAYEVQSINLIEQAAR